MQVCVLAKPSNRLKGFLGLKGLCIATNIYVLTLDRKEGNLIWEEVVLTYKPKGALFIQSEPRDPWFSVRSYGSLEGEVTDLDGLPVRTHSK